MVVHQVFAHILDTKIQNIIVCDNYELANQLARAIYGQSAIAQECTQYPCGIGDYFVNNTFFYADKDDPEKVGEAVPRKNTAEEDAAEANAKATSIETDVANNTIEIEYLKALTGVEDEVVVEEGPIDNGPVAEGEATAETTEEKSE
jgi:hypothetical protein